MPTPVPFSSHRGFSIASSIHGKTNYRTYTIVGRHPGVTATNITSNGPYTLWSGPTVRYPWLAAAAQLEIVSTSANDAFGGTGTNVALVRVINAAGVESQVFVPLAGLTPVTIPGGPWLRINDLTSAVCGTSRTNAGVLTARVQGGGAVLAHVTAGIGGPAKQFIYTVPAGFYMLVDTWFLTALTPNGNSPGDGTYSASLNVRFAGDTTNTWSQLITFGANQSAGTQTVVPQSSTQAWRPRSDVELLIDACSSPGTLYPTIALNFYLVPEDAVMTYPPHLSY